MKPDMRSDMAPGSWWNDNHLDWQYSVEIGARTVIKEHVSIHAGTYTSTIVGEDCYLMPKVHIGHDVNLIGECTLAPNVQIAGHVLVGRGATIGMSAQIHQHVRIGCGSMIGMGTQIRKNVEVFSKVVGLPQQNVGMNSMFLEKLGLSEEEKRLLKEFLIYRKLHISALNPKVQELVIEFNQS